MGPRRVAISLQFAYTAWMTGVIAVTSICYALVSYGQWQALRESNHMLELERRAWINPAFNNLPPQIRPEGGDVLEIIGFTNTGETPAKQIFVNGTIKEIPSREVLTFTLDPHTSFVGILAPTEFAYLPRVLYLKPGEAKHVSLMATVFLGRSSV